MPSPASTSRLRFFFFNDTATTEIYTLSLHDALPICVLAAGATGSAVFLATAPGGIQPYQSTFAIDRKSTRLNSSYVRISYAVFCLKKKKRPHDYAGYR